MTEATAVATRSAVPAPLMAGGAVAAIIPRSVEEMFRLATAIAASGLAPRTMDTKEKVLVAIMAGAELGLAPHQAVQSFYVVNQKPTLWGDAIPALLWSNGFKLKEWFEGEGDALIAKCEVTRPGGDVIPGEFSMDDARKANLLGKDGPWKTATKRMLKMRARAFAARDGAADVLRGMQIREEVEDYHPIRDVTPQVTGMRARLEARSPTGGFDAQHVGAALDEATQRPDGAAAIDVVLEGDSPPPHDADTGEVFDVDTEAPETADDTFPGDLPLTQGAGGANNLAGGGFDPLEWAAGQNAKIEDAEHVADIDALAGHPDAPGNFAALKSAHPGAATALDAAMRGKRKALADRERAQ